MQTFSITLRYRPLCDVTIDGPPWCPVWCRLVTVLTDPLTTFTRQTAHFGLNGRRSATQKHPKWQNCTSDRESDGRFWIGRPGFVFEFPSNYMSISLSLGDIRVRQTDRRTTRSITIAGPHIVAGEIITHIITSGKRPWVLTSMSRLIALTFVRGS